MIGFPDSLLESLWMLWGISWGMRLFSRVFKDTPPEVSFGWAPFRLLVEWRRSGKRAVALLAASLDFATHWSQCAVIVGTHFYHPSRIRGSVGYGSTRETVHERLRGSQCGFVWKEMHTVSGLTLNIGTYSVKVLLLLDAYIKEGYVEFYICHLFQLRQDFLWNVYMNVSFTVLKC